MSHWRERTARGVPRPTFGPPPLRVDATTLRRYFATTDPHPDVILRNYHHEEPVAVERHATARRAAVLLPFIDDASPRFLLTRRHEAISAPGHICFPGGTRDTDDDHAIATALRETREETGLAPDRIEPLGTLGRYYSHSGHEIVPVVGLVHPPYELTPNPREVDEILYLPADAAFRPQAYELRQHDPEHPRAHYFVALERGAVTGPTVCILMHLYECLAGFLSRGGDAS